MPFGGTATVVADPGNAFDLVVPGFFLALIAGTFLKAMLGRTGKMARVVRGGTVRPGDPIELIGRSDADAAHELNAAHVPG